MSTETTPAKPKRQPPTPEQSRRGRGNRKKGQVGEREVCHLLQPVIDYCYKGRPEAEIPKMQRNTIQSDDGGYDIVGLDWLGIEVKRCEKLAVATWWAQTDKQAADLTLRTGIPVIPVLFYRQSKGAWRVRMEGFLRSEEPSGAVDRTYLVEIDVMTFRNWLYTMINHKLADKAFNG